MPGISTGLANPNDYLLGRGLVTFGAHVGLTNLPGDGYRDLGNCTELKITAASTSVDHFSSRTSARFADRSALTSTKYSLEATFDELNADNIAMWMGGTTGQITGLGLAVTTAAVLSTGTAATIVGGRWYDVFQEGFTIGGLVPMEHRLYDLGAVTITGGTSPTEGTDYIVDYRGGRIFIVAGGVCDAISPTLVKVAVVINSPTGGNIDEARGMTGKFPRGSLRFYSINAANNDEIREITVNKIQLIPSGDMSLLGDSWATFKMMGTLESNPTMNATSPFFSSRTASRLLVP
jgi:hypothetical protein